MDLMALAYQVQVDQTNHPAAVRIIDRVIIWLGTTTAVVRLTACCYSRNNSRDTPRNRAILGSVNGVTVRVGSSDSPSNSTGD